MDYAPPRADDLPSYNLGYNGTRCTTNPLGVKGCGEAVAVAAFPAATNAIAGALGAARRHRFRRPAAPERIWRAMNDADQPGRRKFSNYIQPKRSCQYQKMLLWYLH